MVRDVSIPFHSQSIDATIHADVQSNTLIIVCHGFTDSKEATGIREISKLLAEHAHVLRFTFTDAKKPHLPTEIENVKAITDFYRNAYAKIVVIGHSLGGLTAITSTADNPDIDALVVINPFVDLYKKIAWQFRKVLIVGALSLPFSRRMRDNYHAMLTQVKPESISIPTLVIVAQKDQLVEPAHGMDFYRRLQSSHKKLIVDDVVEHGLHTEGHRKRVVAYIINWLTSL
jgi:alpha-beta hydrolase superfamily lysophospholipase